MKKMLLIGLVFVAGTTLSAQTIQLPGIGSTNITIASSQISATSQLVFSNPEYNVIGFTLKFPTNSNPAYVATSADNHFTADMLTNIPQLLAGNDMDLQLVLKAPGAGHESWQKNYQVHVSN